MGQVVGSLLMHPRRFTMVSLLPTPFSVSKVARCMARPTIVALLLFPTGNPLYVCDNIPVASANGKGDTIHLNSIGSV